MSAQPSLPPSPTGQRCRLSILFCDLSGSTALSESLEAEDYFELLASLRRLYAGVVAAHGGTLVRIQGDGMLAIFGWPTPREGDSRRAVEAAVQLHREVSALGEFGARGQTSALRLHSGVHAGLVLVQRGGLMLGSLELLGAAPNVAGRLSDAAGDDEILASVDCLGPDLHHFDCGPERQVAIDARGHTVAARPVLGRGQRISSFEARTRRGLQPFIGRLPELAQIEATLGRVLGGAVQRVALVAPPGLGKTRLARETLAQAAWKGCRVLEAHASDEAGGAPLQALLQLLRGAIGVGTDASRAEHQAALAQLLAELEPDAAPSPATASLQQALAAPLLDALAGTVGEATIRACSALFEAAAALRPLVIFVDDWQWVDLATRQTLAALGRDRPQLPLLLLATAREFDAADAELYGVERLLLPPFSAAETTASVHRLMPRADPFVAAEIWLYSGGNPLFIEELCHSAEHEDLEHWQVRRLPGASWLNVLVAARAARLPAESTALLRLAAVIGNVVPPGLLQRLSGLGAGASGFRVLAEQDLLYADADGGFRFKHGLTRDVIVESIGLHERRALHRRVAEALADAATPAAELPHDALALHWAGAGEPALAATHAETAGDRAAAASVLDRAKRMYHLALEQLERIDRDAPLDRADTGAGARVGADAASADVHRVDRADRARRWLAIADRLGLIAVFDGARQDLPVFERGARIARTLEAARALGPSGDPAAVARAEHWLGYVLYALGDSTASIAHVRAAAQAVAAAGAGDDPFAVQVRSTLGQALAAAAQYDAALPLLEEAVEIKRAHVLLKGHRAGTRNAVGLAYSLTCLASVWGDRGAFDRAYALLDEAQGLVDLHGHQIGASITGWRSAVLCWQGDWHEARKVAEESAWIAERTRSLFQFVQGRATAAYAGWRLDGDPHSIDIAEQATAWLEPRDSGLFRSLNHGWLAEGWMAIGERDKARRHAALALARGRHGDLIGAAMTCRALARDAAARGDGRRAERWLARAERVAARRQSAHEAAANRQCAQEIRARRVA